MRQRITEALPGQIVVFTYGDYSDYTVAGVVIVQKQFDILKTRKEFYENNKTKVFYTYPEANGKFYYESPKISAFMAHLETEGLAKEADSMEYNGDYDETTFGGLAKIEHPEYY